MYVTSLAGFIQSGRTDSTGSAWFHAEWEEQIQQALPGSMQSGRNRFNRFCLVPCKVGGQIHRFCLVPCRVGGQIQQVLHGSMHCGRTDSTGSAWFHAEWEDRFTGSAWFHAEWEDRFNRTAIQCSQDSVTQTLTTRANYPQECNSTLPTYPLNKLLTAISTCTCIWVVLQTHNIKSGM